MRNVTRIQKCLAKMNPKRLAPKLKTLVGVLHDDPDRRYSVNMLGSFARHIQKHGYDWAINPVDEHERHLRDWLTETGNYALEKEALQI